MCASCALIPSGRLTLASPQNHEGVVFDELDLSDLSVVEGQDPQGGRSGRADAVLGVEDYAVYEYCEYTWLETPYRKSLGRRGAYVDGCSRSTGSPDRPRMGCPSRHLRTASSYQ